MRNRSRLLRTWRGFVGVVVLDDVVAAGFAVAVDVVVALLVVVAAAVGV